MPLRPINVRTIARVLALSLTGGVLLFASSACSSFHLPFTKPATDAAPSAAAVQLDSIKGSLARARGELSMLEADPALSARVPTEIKAAEEALKTADASKYDPVTGAHQVYVADHKVQLARVRAESRQLAADLETLRAQRDQLAGPATSP